MSHTDLKCLNANFIYYATHLPRRGGGGHFLFILNFFCFCFFSFIFLIVYKDPTSYMSHDQDIVPPTYNVVSPKYFKVLSVKLPKWLLNDVIKCLLFTLDLLILDLFSGSLPYIIHITIFFFNFQKMKRVQEDLKNHLVREAHLL